MLMDTFRTLWTFGCKHETAFCVLTGFTMYSGLLLRELCQLVRPGEVGCGLYEFLWTQLLRNWSIHITFL